MKSYMISLLVIGIALGGLGLGTFAYLSDVDTVSGNSLATGTVDLGVQCYGYGVDGAPIADQKLVAEGLLPSEEFTPVGYVKIWNKGDGQIKWKGFVVPTGSNSGVNEAFLAWTEVQLVKNPVLTDQNWAVPEGCRDLPWGGWDNEGSGVTPAVVLVNLVNPDNQLIRGGDSIAADGNVEYMEEGYWQVFRVDMRIKSDCHEGIENIWGQKFWFDFKFDSTQFENSVWPAPIDLSV